MSDARTEILARVRAALADTPATATLAEAEAASPVDWEHQRTRTYADPVRLFAERVADYTATVVRAEPGGAAEQIAAELSARGARRVVIPPEADERWVSEVEAAGIEVLRDQPALDPAALDAVDGVVTGCAVGIAETGTLVLDHTGDQGRRAVSLVPDLHLCVVRTEQVVEDVPQAVGRLERAARAGRPMTWISGPSATSDIELSRVEGVHGPRTLVVVLEGGKESVGGAPR